MSIQFSISSRKFPRLKVWISLFFLEKLYWFTFSTAVQMVLHLRWLNLEFFNFTMVQNNAPSVETTIWVLNCVLFLGCLYVISPMNLGRGRWKPPFTSSQCPPASYMTVALASVGASSVLASSSGLSVDMLGTQKRDRQGPGGGGCWLRAQEFKQLYILIPEQAATQPFLGLDQRLPASLQQPPSCLVQTLAKNSPCQCQWLGIIQVIERARSAGPDVLCSNRLCKEEPLG